MDIVCVGDNNVDIYPDLNVVYPGGDCVNVAAYAASNGCNAAYIGTIGNDFCGEVQKNALTKLGVDITKMRILEGKTSCAHVKVVEGDRVFLDYEENIHASYPLTIHADDMEYMKGFDVIHSCSYTIAEKHFLEKLAKAGKTVSYDFTDDWTYEYLAKASQYIDIGFLSCSHVSEEETRNVLKQMADWGISLAIGTRGEKGAWAYNGKEFFYQPAFCIRPLDTMGAGDSFISMFLTAYIEDRNRETSMCKDKSGTCFLTDSDREMLERGYVSHALLMATEFASYVCMCNGAFGEGVLYDVKEV